jgi:tetratricopeptide (TPR) repeat protein
MEHGMLKQLNLPVLMLSLLPLQALAQNDDLSNLFFSPVPIAQANDSILNNGSSEQRELDRESARELIDRIVSRVDEINERFSDDPDQVLRLNRLGLAYQMLGRHDEALATFAQATDLAVQLYGEDTLEQIPALEQSIISHLERNEISAITEKEEFIYEINARNYEADSPEMYAAMTNLADWYTSAYFKSNYLGDSRRQNIRSSTLQRPERQVGIAEGGSGSMESIANGTIRDISLNDLIDPRLQKIDDLYENYQESYSSNTTLATVLEVARRIARLAYHADQEMNFERVSNTFDANYTGSREEALRNSEERRDESYRSGKEALQYVANLIADIEGINAQQKTLTMLDLADWDLAYGRIDSARQFYRVAYQLLIDDNFNVASIDAALAPTIPVMIPRNGAFPATLQTSGKQGLQEAIDYKGYIDVSFGLDVLGNATGINFLGASEDANTGRIQNTLQDVLQMTKFRPVLRGGELNEQPAMQLRYYYSY